MYGEKLVSSTKVAAMGTNTRKEETRQTNLQCTYVDQLRDDTSFEKYISFEGDDAKQRGVERAHAICSSK